MATPTIADQFTGASAATTGAMTLSATPTLDRLLVSCLAGNTGGTTNPAIVDAGGGAWSTPINRTNADMTMFVAWKFAQANETTVTWSWTTNTAWRAVVVEYNVGVNTFTNSAANDTTSIVTSIASGNLAPNGSNDFGVVIGASDSAATWDNGTTILATFDSSFSEDLTASPTVQTARPLIQVGNLEGISTTQNVTWSTTGATGDEAGIVLLMWYTAATFKSRLALLGAG